VPVWRDPWMVVGRPTFTADLLARAGYEVSTAGVPGRYPAVGLDALDDPAVADLVLLPDEPYVFTSRVGCSPGTGLHSSTRGFRWTDPERVMSPSRPGGLRCWRTPP